MDTRHESTAPAQAAGYILQLDRALHHLALAASREIGVAVEHVDDIAAMRDGKVILVEQDKSSSRPAVQLLANRSRAFWRTLQIWLEHCESPDGQYVERRLFFVNQWVSSPIAMLLKDRTKKTIEVADVVKAMRQIGAKRSRSKIQEVIDDVLSRSDEDLAALVKTIEIVEADDPVSERAKLANGLGLDPRADADDILDGLLGWLTTKVRTEWSEGRPGMITRNQILIQSHALQDKQAKSRFLPRPSADIVVSDEARKGALARNFVEHLGRISAEREDVVQAVDHFLKFSIEKHRLVRTGDVPDAEWRNRSNRLRERWDNLMRRKKRELAGSTSATIGQTVLADTTYEYRESLDGQMCDELYMTSGHYHRLAEEDEVWWDPNFSKEMRREG
ncbi:ABC-three component system protein [Bradyrhizobium sp. 200]|uniref:ABC-three component system protein n=1 Tax=Bradyrhizobium sp. 200 TaxID=2782665 RepID=UPI001FFF71D4|nr:ABC-three component system protein [Bradyrhizobium sp. 200]